VFTDQRASTVYYRLPLCLLARETVLSIWGCHGVYRSESQYCLVEAATVLTGQRDRTV